MAIARKAAGTEHRNAPGKPLRAQGRARCLPRGDFGVVALFLIIAIDRFADVQRRLGRLAPRPGHRRWFVNAICHTVAVVSLLTVGLVDALVSR